MLQLAEVECEAGQRFVDGRIVLEQSFEQRVGLEASKVSSKIGRQLQERVTRVGRYLMKVS